MVVTLTPQVQGTELLAAVPRMEVADHMVRVAAALMEVAVADHTVVGPVTDTIRGQECTSRNQFLLTRSLSSSALRIGYLICTTDTTGE